MTPPLHSLAAPAVSRIRQWVLGAFPRGQSGIDYDQPPGDPGLFGADSITWRIHADFPGMLSGGLCALMLQTLHPLALAGVWDHSQFRTDLLGRLRRTTNFVAGTTYAGRAEAERLIAHVDAIHARVHGVTADGRPYRARDPRLLTWVHVTESYGFLEGFRRYAPMALPHGFADRYFDESRRVALALGACDVPGSEAQVADYFESVQDELRYDERSREVLAVLARIELPVPAAALSRNLFLGAGSALLPTWAASRLRLSRPRQMQSAIAARALRGISPLFRLALNDGVAPRACRRVGVAESVLDGWPP
ncbi:oxygenase MpaB family protein [Lysobacter sp. S4-A87]|uniref:oxygenase MpaB family protein n=1 Tax=Lysobacter sp. S4-A87 TaxID=2925843 RepID=UPI001F5307B4|nr:oxygenase MpaB family protein [Lysobacter sp. S4-A87]UNK49588.1 oxygenase MpaB family protein [Lysobacter sp. S4-A87]